MPSLSHESLKVYQRSIEMVAWSAKLIERYKVSGPLLDQFKRAIISIPLNIAKRAGNQTGKNQARFYDMGNGSAMETAACLDVLVAMDGATPADVAEGKARITEIVSMLTGLSKTVAPIECTKNPLNMVRVEIV